MNNPNTDKHLMEAVHSFGFEESNSTVESISAGFINSTFKVSNKSRTIILQKLNGNVFPKPEDIVHNYIQVYNYLNGKKEFKIPEPIKTIDKKNCFVDNEKNIWRATQFIHATFSPETARDEKDVAAAAYCFGSFTNGLAGLDVSELKVIIPQFHDLAFRYDQFSEALENNFSKRKENARIEIEELIKRKKLVDFYTELISNSNYKLRVMHHDAKLSNILFDRNTEKVVCPVDLDTTQSGYFFSDIGDMIRSMTCNLSENSVDFSAIKINEDFYKEIIKGYMYAMRDEFTYEEKINIHYSGLLMIYMQALRYMADHLNGDIYYRITYPEQNFDRTKNQLTLLKRLEEFLAKEFNFNPY